MANNSNLNKTQLKAQFDRLKGLVEAHSHSDLSQAAQIKLSNSAPPLKSLPRILLLEGQQRDELTLTFQIRTDLEAEKRFGSLGFICHFLRFGVQGYLQASGEGIVKYVGVEYGQFYSLVTVVVEYFVEGLTQTHELIATVLKVLDQICGEFVHLKAYSEASSRLRAEFDASELPSGSKLARLLSRNMKKFGLVRAIVGASKSLNQFNKQHIRSVLAQFAWENLLITIQGDFGYKPENGQKSIQNTQNLSVQGEREVKAGQKRPQSQKTQIYPQKKFELYNALKQRIFDKFDFYEQKKITGSLHLTQKDPEFGIKFHTQPVTHRDIFEVESLKSGIKTLKITQNNPYALKEQKFKISEFRQESRAQDSQKHDSYISLFSNSSLVLFYRPIIRPSPSFVHIVLRFAFLDKSLNLSPETLKYHAYSLVVERIWLRRLSKIRSQIASSNGEIEVKFHQKSIRVVLHAPRVYARRLFSDLLARICFSRNPLFYKEIENGVERVIRRLTAGGRKAFRRALDEFGAVFLEGGFGAEKIENFLRKDQRLIEALQGNPVLIFGLVEGGLGLDEVQNMFFGSKGLSKYFRV